MELITLKNLELGYDDKVVLKKLDLTINEGDFVCVVGQNGSGKTTLIRGILGLIKPLSGKITFNGFSQKQIGYMPQETAVDPHFPASVFEIVLSGTLNEPHCFYNNASKQHAMDALKQLGIEKLKDASFTELSGGQRQRVLLARALAATKKLLVLDEPSNNLDRKSKDGLYRLIQKINSEQKITIIMVTHDLDHYNLVGNKILSLREGDFFYGTTDEFVKKVHHHE
jgi:zinc transport system ATP-binding protein